MEVLSEWIVGLSTEPEYFKQKYKDDDIMIDLSATSSEPVDIIKSIIFQSFEQGKIAGRKEFKIELNNLFN